MEADGPTTRRGNSSPADHRAKSDGSDRFDPARNSSSRPAATFGHLGGAITSTDSAAAAPAGTATASPITHTPRRSGLRRGSRGSLLNEIIGLIGLDGATRLIDAFAGMRLYVPESPEPDDLLSVSIGLDAAIKLGRFYGRDRIDVPNPTPRRIKIIELRANGESIDTIARSLRCTRRRVFQVLAEARQDRHREIRQQWQDRR